MINEHVTDGQTHKHTNTQTNTHIDGMRSSSSMGGYRGLTLFRARIVTCTSVGVKMTLILPSPSAAADGLTEGPNNNLSLC